VRVVFVLNAFEIDGPGRLVLDVAARVAANGRFRPEVFALSRDGLLRPRLEAAGLPARVLGMRGLGGLMRLRHWARSLAADPPAVVHTHLAWPDLALRTVAGELGFTALVSTGHGMNLRWDKGALRAAAYGVLDRATRPRCRAWIAVSDAVRRDMVAAGYPERAIRVVPNGVDTAAIRPLPPARRADLRGRMGVAEHDLLAVAAGTLRPLKGQDILLRAVARLAPRHPRLRLVLLGDGPWRSHLEGLAADLGIADRVRFAGVVAEGVPEMLGAADVFVHASRNEAYGIAIAEAMAAGVPVVATRVGGIPEVVRDGETGALVPPEDPEAFAAAMGAVLDDAGLRERFAREGRVAAERDHDIGRTARGYEAFWDDVVAGRFPP